MLRVARDGDDVRLVVARVGDVARDGGGWCSWSAGLLVRLIWVAGCSWSAGSAGFASSGMVVRSRGSGRVGRH